VALPRRQADLAATLLTRFEFDGNRGDLVEACQLLEAAVASAPSASQERAEYLMALGETLERRYAVTGSFRDLVSAADAYRTAMMTATGHPERGLALGRVLMALGRPDEAVQVLRDSVAGLIAELGADHPDAMKAALTLARALAAVDRRSEAVATLDALLLVQGRVLGTDHADTQAARELREALG